MIIRAAFRLLFRDRVGRAIHGTSLAVIIVGAIARDGAEPSPKARNIPQGMKLAQHQQKDFLDQVVYFAGRHAAEQNAMYHPPIAAVDQAKDRPATSPSNAN